MFWWTLRQLNSKNPKTRIKAIEKLGNSRDARAVTPLIVALKDVNVRVKAIEALGKIGTPAVEPLTGLLKEDSSCVRNTVIKAMASIGSPAVGSLIDALKDKDSVVRKEVTIALGEIGDIRAVEPVKEVFKNQNDWVIKFEAAMALSEMGDVTAVDYLYNLSQELKGNVKNKYYIERILKSLNQVLKKSVVHIKIDSLMKFFFVLPDVDVIEKRHEGNWRLEEMYGEWREGMTVDGASIPRYGAYTMEYYEIDYSFIKKCARRELIRRGIEIK